MPKASVRVAVGWGAKGVRGDCGYGLQKPTSERYLCKSPFQS